jgi:signal transduction histidine kinase
VPEAVVLISVAIALVSVGLSVRRVRAARFREETARREAGEARSIKNDFVAMVSHELRTPLTSIAGFAQALVTQWRDLPETEVDEFLAHIAKESVYLGELVEDILVITRLEAGRLHLNPQAFDLGEMVQNVAGLLFPSGSGREAAVSLPIGVRLMADPRRVQQVVRNLLENARKYGGEQVLVEGFSYGDQYVLVVSDNGPGVPDDSVERIFEHFEQLSKGDARAATGIGLGLPIARRLARAMGGDVWYERRFPRGSRFCFGLPALSLIDEEGSPSQAATELPTSA